MYKRPRNGWRLNILINEYVMLFGLMYGELAEKIEKYRHKRKIKRILRKNKDIAEISKLAGIK